MNWTFALLRLFGYAVIGFSIGWFVIGPAIKVVVEYFDEVIR